MVGHALEAELLLASLQVVGLSLEEVHQPMVLQEEVHVLVVIQVALRWVVLFPVELQSVVLFLVVLQAVSLVLVVHQMAVHVLEALLQGSNTTERMSLNVSIEAQHVIVTWRWTCWCWPSRRSDTWRRCSCLWVPTRKCSRRLTWWRASGRSSWRWPSSRRHNNI